ncbi:MAG TPA: sulfatase-like hydrolase/transferase [Bacteroidales bacterium]|nr:sulfatase-like hydrolase/transferase [Bacteroidales bacterium]
MKKSFNFLSISIALSCLTFSVAAKERTKKPNIILIMADDLGYGDIGCFGSDYIQTPVLDKLAKQGIRFIDYHSNGAVSTPTRAALMTGNYQQRAGLEGVISAQEGKRIYGISESETTMPEIFREAGYKTGIFGKWHLGYKPEFNPVHHGFDNFYGYLSGNVDYISHRDGIGLYDWWQNADTCFDEGYVTDLITDRALKFMEQNKENPFLLYLPHEAAHFPYQGRHDKADRMPGVDFQMQGSRIDKKQAYKEMVEIMDENIGRVLKKLEELNLDKNTFIFFCSDNGATNQGSNGALNGFKSSLWEGGHRVPAIAWYPGKIKPGKIADNPVLSMDVLPTLLSVAGISNNIKFDGEDFSQVLFSEKEMKERPLFWRFQNQWVVRIGNWKYLKIKEKEYLFDLAKDLGEATNLKDENPVKMKEFRILLKDWEKEMGNYVQQTN